MKVLKDLIIFTIVAALVFLFLIRLRFWHSKSVILVISKRYVQNTVKGLRKLKKLGYRLQKSQIKLEYLVNCCNNSVIPKFLNFRVATKSLKSTPSGHSDIVTILERHHPRCRYDIAHIL